MAVKIIRCEDDRAEEQKVFIETADGKFKYQLFMDYAKGLPEEYKLIPIQGNISGGCVGPDDVLYCGLRGGAVMSPFPLTCLVKLDKDGNYIGTFGKGKLGHLHFFECTDHGTIVVLQTNSDYALEMDLKTEEVVRVFGKKDCPSDTGTKGDITGGYDWDRIHKGLYATEPFSGYNGGTFGAYMSFKNAKMGGPFNKPTDVDFDSQGNYYFSDGYGNVAVQKFDRDGNYVKTWGGPAHFDNDTDDPGKFLVPHSLCVDPKDHIWVCDREKDAVHVFDTEGNVLAYCRGNMSQPSGVDCDDEYVYVVGRGGYITIFDFDCNIVGKLGFFNGNLRGHHIAVDSKGNLYLFPTHANFEHQIIALKRIRD